MRQKLNKAYLKNILDEKCNISIELQFFFQYLGIDFH